jgi:hypothetical protein
MPGSEKDVCKYREHSSQEIKRDKLASAHDILGARTKQEKVDHISGEVEQARMHEKGCKPCEQVASPRDEGEGFEPRRTGRITAKDRHRKGYQIEERTNPHQGERHDGQAGRPIVYSNGQQKKHPGSPLVWFFLVAVDPKAVKFFAKIGPVASRGFSKRELALLSFVIE